MFRRARRDAHARSGGASALAEQGKAGQVSAKHRIDHKHSDHGGRPAYKELVKSPEPCMARLFWSVEIFGTNHGI